MKVSSRVMVAWAIAVFLLIGLVFVLITLGREDETDMEPQPSDDGGSSSLGVVAPLAPGAAL